MSQDRIFKIIELAVPSLGFALLPLAWQINKKLCVILAFSLIMLVIYFLLEWKYKTWKDSKYLAAARKHAADDFKALLHRLHYVISFIIFLIIAFCTSLIFIQATAPSYADEFVLESLHGNEDQVRTISLCEPPKELSNISLVATTKSMNIKVYPMKRFVELILVASLQLFSDLAWSVLVITFCAIITAFLAEKVGGISHGFV